MIWTLQYTKAYRRAWFEKNMRISKYSSEIEQAIWDSEYNKAYRRAWYEEKAKDPEYRKKLAKNQRDWQQRKKKTDPEYIARKNAYYYNRNKEQMKDPEYRKKIHAAKRDYYREKSKDPEYRVKLSAYHRSWYQQQQVEYSEYYIKMLEYQKEYGRCRCIRHRLMRDPNYSSMLMNAVFNIMKGTTS